MGTICSNRVHNRTQVVELVPMLDNEDYYTLPVSFQTRTAGERITVDVGIWIVRPLNNTLNTPLAVFVHGAPGSSQNFAVIGRKLAGHGIRVVGFDFPGHGKSRLSRQDIYRLDHSTEGKYDMLCTVLDALAITRVDVLIGHSAGTWLNYKAAADLYLAKSSVFLNPLSKRRPRTMHPYWILKLLAALLRNSSLHSTTYRCLPFVYKVSGFSLEKDAFPSLPASIETVRYADLDKMQDYAETVALRKHPFVMAITKNDKIVEWNFAMEMARHMGIEEQEITEYGKDSVTVGDVVGKYDESCYRRVLLFERGGHLVHRSHEAVIIKHILQLLKAVCNHDS
ncbi:uncharacterized protein LOC117315194 [Pecten maximus]|uniref:uncharacterized protein LOC117315194 n=1 Tax=Pecten maximus TaxID=6579 RepID=UPI001458C1A2|nr:uncharacterized protein LOC117315194 [Pecten maximus]